MMRSEMNRRFRFCATFAYLAALGGFLLQSALGDAALFPVSYFFTWDMFPSYYSESSRRVAVGKTNAGRYLQLHPSPREQYRGGVHGDLTRVELERRGFFYRAAVERSIEANAERELPDPIAHVFLFEKFWPAKFNYPADLYEAWSARSRPDRVSWRLVGEFDAGSPGVRAVTPVERPRGEGP
jgi:hypothetical protein